MAATLRRTFRYPGDDQDHDIDSRQELDEEGLNKQNSISVRKLTCYSRARQAHPRAFHKKRRTECILSSMKTHSDTDLLAVLMMSPAGLYNSATSRYCRIYSCDFFVFGDSWD